MQIVELAKKHPLATGVVVFVVGFVALKLTGVLGGGGGSSSSNSSNSDPNVAAYYAAESAQAQAGDALQAVQIQSSAATSQAQIAATSSVLNNNTWANTDLAQTESNNATSVEVAPYAVQNNLVSTLGQIASVPGGTSTTTTQSSNSDSGFFGIGASSSSGTNTSSVYVPNPAAETASQLLSSLTTSGIYAAH